MWIAVKCKGSCIAKYDLTLHTTYLAHINRHWGVMLMVSNRGMSNEIFLTLTIGEHPILDGSAMFQFQ